MRREPAGERPKEIARPAAFAGDNPGANGGSLTPACLEDDRMVTRAHRGHPAEKSQWQGTISRLQLLHG